MARARPEKTLAPEPKQPAELRILPMQLRIGDRLVDATGELEIIGAAVCDVGRKGRPRACPEAGADDLRGALVGRPRARRGEAGMKDSGRQEGSGRSWQRMLHFLKRAPWVVRESTICGAECCYDPPRDGWPKPLGIQA
jgi:hypothetical protein